MQFSICTNFDQDSHLRSKTKDRTYIADFSSSEYFWLQILTSFGKVNVRYVKIEETSELETLGDVGDELEALELTEE